MKKMLMVMFLGMIAIVMSSCVILVDENGDNISNPKGVVKIQNRDPNREAYIQDVSYMKSTGGSWINCWNYSSETTDSNCNFKLKTGYYKFKITVIYPKYDGYRDYYDEFETDSYETIYIGSYKTTNLTFDGEELFERNY